MFVPPWNRCTRVTATLVRDFGFLALSRDVTAGREDVPGLVELPVTVDWFAKRRGGGVVDRYERGELLAAAVRAVRTRDEDARAPRAVGVMLHHAVTGADDLVDVEALADLLAGHPRAAPRLMAELLPGQNGSAVSAMPASTCATSPGWARPLTSRRAR